MPPRKRRTGRKTGILKDKRPLRRRTPRRAGSKRKRTSKRRRRTPRRRRRRTPASQLRRTDRKQKGGNVKSLAPIFQRHHLEIVGEKPLGDGSFADVWEATDVRPEHAPRQVAVKVGKVHANELQALKDCKGSEHIINVIGHFKDEPLVKGEETDYLVTELVTGGDLFDLVLDSGSGLDETTAKTIFHEILSGVERIHSKGWAHCDLKLENVMQADGGATVKIIDFGFACRTTPDSKCSGKFGTVTYWPPEAGRAATYDGKAWDMYTCGVMLYIMLYFRYPKRGTEEYLAALKARRPCRHPDPIAHAVPADAGEVDSLGSDPPKELSDRLAWGLIQQLMSYDPKKRGTAQDALGHSWVTSAAGAAASAAAPAAAAAQSQTSSPSVRSPSTQSPSVRSPSVRVPSSGSGSVDSSRSGSRSGSSSGSGLPESKPFGHLGMAAAAAAALESTTSDPQ